MLNTSIGLEKIRSIALGGFDGMHCAHQKLFKAIGEEGAIVVIETGYANLTPGMKRQDFAHSRVIILDLEDIRHLDAKGFVESLVKYFPSLEKIVIGYDFRFGKDRSAGSEDLKRHFKGTIEVIDEVIKDGISVHSRTIRALLKEGIIDQANRLLGRNYTIWGDVIAGQGVGSKALVPTLNIATEALLLPKNGVYASLTRLDDEAHFRPSVTFLGHRETLDGSFAIETHIIGDTIGHVQSCEIAFLSYLRDNKKFASLEKLKEAIEIDISKAVSKQHTLEL